MELEDLKEVWAALDAKLQKNVELKESIILEMMKSKAGKLVNRLIIWEIISVVGLLLLLPVCFFWLERWGGRYLTGDIVFYFSATICILYPFWGVFKIHGLMKFDFLKDVSNNIFYINRYNIQIKREIKICWGLIIPVCVILSVLFSATMKAPFFLWVCMTSLFIIALLSTYWLYKKYNKDITSILRSLDEIKELKEK